MVHGERVDATAFGNGELEVGVAVMLELTLKALDFLEIGFVAVASIDAAIGLLVPPS